MIEQLIPEVVAMSLQHAAMVLIAVGIAWALRGAGGGVVGRRSGSGTLGELWHPGPIILGETSKPAPSGPATDHHMP